MSITTRSMLAVAFASALVSGGFAWWWTRLVTATFEQCVGGNPPPGVDCRSDLQFYLAAVFALLALGLALAAAVRGFRSRSASRSVA